MAEQPDKPSRRAGRLQPFKNRGVRPAEAVDRLIRVADDKQALPFPVPSAQQPELQRVDVLELIHKQMGKHRPGGGSASRRRRVSINRSS